MRRWLLVAALLVSAPASAGGLTGREQAEFLGWMVKEGIASSQTDAAAGIRERWADYFCFRYQEPVDIALKARDNLSILAKYRAEGYPNGYPIQISASGEGISFGAGPEPGPKITEMDTVRFIGSGDEALAKSIARLGTSPNRRAVGKLSAKYGYFAAVESGRLILCPKYFRQGMNNDEFRRALTRTLALFPDETINNWSGQSTFVLKDAIDRLPFLPERKDLLNVLSIYWSGRDADLIRYLKAQERS